MKASPRFKAAVALATHAAFLFSTIPVRAQPHDDSALPPAVGSGAPAATAATAATERAGAPVADEARAETTARATEQRVNEASVPSEKASAHAGEERATPSMAATSPSAQTPLSLPSGADKTGVSSQAISIPQGAGKIQGMGESFSMQLSTGVGTFSVPFALPAARGGVSPSLGLAYSSGGATELRGWAGIPVSPRFRGRPIAECPVTTTP